MFEKLVFTAVFTIKFFLGLNQCNLLSCNYGQECSMDKHGITECVCPKSCEPIVRPVCANDGKTYDNMCEMIKSACNQRLNISAKYVGVCGKSIPKIYLFNIT